MADIQKKLVKWGKRNGVFRRLYAKNDEVMIATWKLDLDNILQVFNVRPVILVKAGANLPLPEGTCDYTCDRFHNSS